MSLTSFREIAKFFEEIELRLIASLKRNLKRHKAEEKGEGFEWSAWQAEKLRNIEAFRRKNRQITDEYVDLIDDKTRSLMEQQFSEGEKLAESESERFAGEAAPGISRQPDFFGIDQEKMETLIKDITTLEKKTVSAALRMTDDVYRQVIVKAHLDLATGAATVSSVIEAAVKDFLKKGIDCIQYSDGKRVNISDYIRMALRTASTRATLQGRSHRWKELGYDTVLVSQYGGCSETCEPWQGKVYIDDVFTAWNGEASGDRGKSNYCGKWFPLLSSAIRAGLFHPNCRHTLLLYIDGTTKIPKPIPAEYIKKQRKLERRQRKMERNIRKHKRFCAGISDIQELRMYRSKLKEEQAELREFISEHKDVLKRDYTREKVYEIDFPKEAKEQIYMVGKIDTEIYKCITDDIVTDEVIITGERIQHIKERHPKDYEMIESILDEAIKKPSYILEDEGHLNTGLVLKLINDKNMRFQIVIKIHTSSDGSNFKNSIISAWKISEKRWESYINNKKILYKSE